MLNPVVLARNDSGLGTLAYLVNQGLPIFIPDLRVDDSLVHAEFSEIEALKPYAGLLSLNHRRACQGRTRHDVVNRNIPLTLMVVPTLACNMSCSYCYAKSKKPQKGSQALFSFLEKHGKKFKRATVFGGDSLMIDEMPEIMRSCTAEGTELIFMTGLGFEESDLVRKVENLVKHDCVIGMSIDPPPQPGFSYSRVYSGFKGDWYKETIRRVGVIHKLGARWRAGATSSDACCDHRILRSDLSAATGVPVEKVVLNAGHVKQDSFLTNLKVVEKALENDANDAINGRLNLKLMGHFKRVFELLMPSAFMQQGCGMYSQIAIGPDGNLNYCPEVPTLLASEKQKFEFGTEVDPSKYAVAYEQYFKSSECSQCCYRNACRSRCPLLTDEKCAFYKVVAKQVFRILANVDDPSLFEHQLAERVESTARWMDEPVLTREEIESYGAEILA